MQEIFVDRVHLEWTQFKNDNLNIAIKCSEGSLWDRKNSISFLEENYY